VRTQLFHSVDASCRRATWMLLLPPWPALYNAWHGHDLANKRNVC
jgi:hypothetical protein